MGPEDAEQPALKGCELTDFRGLDLDLDAAAEDGVGKLLGQGAEEEQEGIVGRFLQRLEEGVGCLKLEPVGVDEDANFPGSEHGAEVEFAFEVAHLLDDDAPGLGLGLDKMDIDFITLRRRSPSLLKEVYGLPRSAWRTVELDIPSRQYRHPRVFEQTVQLVGHPFRQLFITDLGHEEPTILLTNQAHLSATKLITRYARRMLIENSISDAVRFFHLDALSSAVGLKVDFDMVLMVIASGLYRLLARRMRGYNDAQARQVFRDLVNLPADVEISEKEVRVEFHRRAHLPIVLASELCQKSVSIPWWNNRKLQLTTYQGT